MATTRHDLMTFAEAEELRLLRDFFENAGLGLHWVGPDGTILRANRADYEALGYSEDEYVGHNIVEFHADQHVIDDILARLSRGERLQSYPARLRSKDGSVRDVVIDSSVNFEDGEFMNTRCITRDVTEQLRAERALQDSEARYALAARASRIGAWEWDMGEMVQWTDSLEEMYGFEPGTFPATFDAFSERLHPDDRERVFGVINGAVETGEEMDFEHRIVLPSGELKWLHGRGRAIIDETGKPVRMVGIAVDITERKQAEAAIRESEERALSLAEAMPALVVMMNERAEIEFANEGYRRYTGLPWPEAAAWREHSIVHEDDLTQVEEAWRAPVARGESVQSEMRLRRHDGTYRWHLVQARPLRDPEAQRIRWVTVGIDIDDRKRAEECDAFLGRLTVRVASLHDPAEIVAEVARQSVPTLADVCSVGFIDRTPETVRVETVGPTEAEAPHVARIHLRRWLERPGTDRTIGDVVAGGAAVFMPEMTADWIRACAPDEGQREAGMALADASAVCAPLVVRGETIGMVTFAYTRSGRRYSERDVSLFTEVAARVSVAVDSARLFRELRQTADDLLRANATKDEFLGLVSHELRTPITTVLGNAQILAQRGEALDAEARRTATLDIAEEARRLNTLIDDLLTLARLERGKLDGEPLALGRVVEQLVGEYDERSRRTIRVEDRSGGAIVVGDSNLVGQVIRNYLSNAEKYSPRGSETEVVVERADGEGRIRVLDRGMGIDAAEADRLFEPFYRSSASGSAGGLGIGLAVCRRLIEAVGGRVWAAPRDGGGSEFGFALALCVDDDDA